MALTIAEASAVNTVLDWLDPHGRDTRHVTDEKVLAALVTLAKGSQKALQAGRSPEQVTDRYMVIANRLRDADKVAAVRKALR